MKPIKISILAVITFFHFYNISSQWIQTGGPVGGFIECMKMSNHNIYIGTEYGLFKSTNNGTSWSLLNGMTHSVVSIEAKGDTVWAGTWDTGLFISTDGGNSWVYSGFDGTSVTNIFMFGNKLFASAYQLYVSTDNGYSWNMTGFQTDFVRCNTSNNGLIFIGTWGEGVYASSDTGQTWSTVNNGFNQLNCYALEKKDNFIFAGMYGDGNGIYRSSNNGNNWYPCNNGLYLFGVLDIHNSNGTLYTSIAGAGIYYSTNNGDYWNAINNGFGDETHFTTIRSKNDTIYAGSFGNGMFSTTNQGQVWNQINNGLSIQLINSICSKDNFIFSSVAFAGIFRSSDEGISWQKKNNGIDFWDLSPIDTSGNMIYIGCEGGVYSSSNYGDEWLPMGRPTYNGMVISFLFHNNYIFADNDNLAGLYMTSNYGYTWNQVGLNNCDVNCLLLKDSILFAGVLDVSNNFGIYSSTDFGVTWTGTLTNHCVNCFVQDSNDIYAGVTCGYVGVYKSINNGLSWYSTGLSTHSVYSLINIDGNIFAGADNGIYLSTNNGSSWVNVSDNLSNVFVNSIRKFDTYLYLGTNGHSVWKRPVSELIGIKGNSKNIPICFNLYQNYPNPFNPVTKIMYHIPASPVPSKGGVKVVLKIYDILGREVMTLVNNELKQAGRYYVEFNGNNFASGVYFYKIEADKFVQAKKMVLVK